MGNSTVICPDITGAQMHLANINGIIHSVNDDYAKHMESIGAGRDFIGNSLNSVVDKLESIAPKLKDIERAIDEGGLAELAVALRDLDDIQNETIKI